MCEYNVSIYLKILRICMMGIDRLISHVIEQQCEDTTDVYFRH